MIAIVDYGAGNLRSIERALMRLDEAPVITGDPDTIADASAIVFPGVGNARAAMDRLRSSGIANAMISAADSGTPLLGICLGMQLLFGDQEEGPTTGLGLLPGCGVRLPTSVKSPHMGWNTVRFTENGPFAGEPDAIFYFVHSYLIQPDRPGDVAGITAYGVEIPAVIAHGNIWGTQFHPEKSGDVGIALLDRWVNLARSVVAS